MKNPLLKSVIVVTMTWWLGLSLIWARSVPNPFSVLGDLALTGSLAATGFAATLAVIWMGRRATIGNLTGRAHRGLSVSMGSIPAGLGEPKRLNKACLKAGDHRLARWYAKAKAAGLPHAAVFEACLQVYGAHKDLPASPIPGGHGGITLVEHALHVAEVTLEMA
jgi:hypothetical protein